MDFANLVDHRVKLKESEKRVSSLNLLGNWKKRNMKVTVIPIVIGALCIVTTYLLDGLHLPHISKKR